MFKSKTREIIIPQSEHAHLAGIVALLWGNDAFDRPEFDFHSFVAGVAFHDFGHGNFDTNEIGAMDDDRANNVDAALVNCKLPNPIADAVAHFHILRLLKNGSNSELIKKCEERILHDLKSSGIAQEKLIWADKITAFCDYLSFDFCFDKPATRICEVSPKRGNENTVSVHINYDGDETITLDPWPLNVNNYKGYILGYASYSYPNILQPVVKKYILQPE
ncbi:MAG: DUF3891 family protein [Calditrichaeota bacterium]|nr:MAG: DUF3891 family protein [Calditrichota bacterium]